MKKIILSLASLVFIIGCSEQIEKTQEFQETIEEPEQITEQEVEEIIQLPNGGDITEKPETAEPKRTKEWEVYNPETGETELVDMPATEAIESTTTSEGDELLKTACKNAINDYPEWTKTRSDVVVWEDSKDKKFYFRNSCEDLSVSMDSPAGTSELLADIDFIDASTVGYVKKGQEWQIGLFVLNNPDTSVVYEKSEPVSSIDVSFIDKNTFIMFYITNDGKVFLKYVKNSKEETLFETSAGNGNHKVAASPKGTYAYLLYDKILRVFDISTKTKIDEINSVSSVVWIGDSHLLYSNSGGTYIYDVESENSNKITKINTADILTFNPKSRGIIAYTTNSKASVVSCQNWKILGNYGKGEIETLADERTAILTKEDLSTSGYWRFEGDWYIKLSDEFSSFDSNTLLATVWSKY